MKHVILVGVLAVMLAGCSGSAAPQGGMASYMPGSARSGGNVQPMALPTDEPVATATPPEPTPEPAPQAVAQVSASDDDWLQLSPASQLIVMSFVVIVGIPLFWVVGLNRQGRTS